MRWDCLLPHSSLPASLNAVYDLAHCWSHGVGSELNDSPSPDVKFLIIHHITQHPDEKSCSQPIQRAFYVELDQSIILSPT